MKERIVICMPLKNAERTLLKSITSVLKQKAVKREIVLLIGNDNSNDSSINLLETLLPHPSITLLKVNLGKAFRVRNYLNNYARKNISDCVLIGRLDADDVLFDDYTISKIEALYEQYKFDVLLCGNQQSKNGKILDYKNHPSQKMLDDTFLANQLQEMAKGNFSAELPSCNTFISPKVQIQYPEQKSAEDHWFTVFLLLQKNTLKIHIDEELLYCIYSLDGVLTKTNKANQEYIYTRLKLANFFSEKLKSKSFEKINQKWSDFIVSGGMDFHRKNIEKNESKLQQYWQLSSPLHHKIAEEAVLFDKKKLRLLDVGCGPFPKSGIYLAGYTIERHLIDTLADEYSLLLEEYEIETNGQSILKCDAENIDTFFAKNTFDLIFSKNALDHTFNPIKAIESMVNLLAPNGRVILEHYIREGEYTGYFGLHQWNFYILDDDFILSNENETIIENVNKLLPNCTIKSDYFGNKIVSVIRKNTHSIL